MAVANISVKGIFRVNDWWQSKAALLMGMVYLFAAWFNIPFSKLIPLALLSLTTIAGFASFGYLVNDLFDIKADAIAGKNNFMAGKPAVFVFLLLIISCCLIFIPWLYLPHTVFSFMLIAVQLLLFLIYSIPPIRLKERGIAGIITDALYAHALPPILAAYTFSLAGEGQLPVLTLSLLFVWQMLSGVRNILLHQVDDLDFDKKAGVKNYIAGLTRPQLHIALKYFMLFEIFISVALFAFSTVTNTLFLLPLITILLLSEVAFFLFRSSGVEGMLQKEWRYFPNNVYEKWLPAAYLAILSFSDSRFIIVMILHIALFNFGFYIYSATKTYQWGQPVLKEIFIYARIFIAILVNHIIYYSLRIFGIDLKKENTDALGYFKRKLGGK